MYIVDIVFMIHLLLLIAWSLQVNPLFLTYYIIRAKHQILKANKHFELFRVNRYSRQNLWYFEMHFSMFRLNWRNFSIQMIIFMWVFIGWCTLDYDAMDSELIHLKQFFFWEFDSQMRWKRCSWFNWISSHRRSIRWNECFQRDTPSRSLAADETLSYPLAKINEGNALIRLKIYDAINYMSDSLYRNVDEVAKSESR